MLTFKNTLGMSRMTEMYTDIERVIVDDTVYGSNGTIEQIHEPMFYRTPHSLQGQTIETIVNEDMSPPLFPNRSDQVDGSEFREWQGLWKNRMWRQVFLYRNKQWERHIITWQAYLMNQDGKTIEKIMMQP